MFKSQPLLKQKTIGEQLHLARQAREFTLEYCADALRISAQHLRALEEGRYNDLPSPVYIKNYIQLYAAFVHIDWMKIAEQYEQEIRVFYAPQDQGIVGPEDTAHIRSTKRHRSPSTSGHQKHALVIPRLLKFGVAGIFVLLLALYFVWQVVRFLTPPDLVISRPDGDVIVTEPNIVIEGQSEPEAIVEINSQPVSVGTNGGFTEEVFVHDGLNAIRITARSKQSRERVEIRNVLYNISVDRLE